MDHLVTIISQYLESHSVPHITGNSDPPPRFFFGGWKSFVGVKIEDRFIEWVFKESRDVL
jgi:hypothetical protein